MKSEARVPGDIGRTAVRGALFTVGGQGGKILVQILSVVILARLLAPHDYGLLAMVTAVVGIAEIFRDFGLSSAAIQAPTLHRSQRDNLFWLNAGIGALLAILVAVGAPLLAHVYDEPRLVELTRVLALVFVVNGLATQYRANLTRELRFRSLMVADLAGPVVALLVAAACALHGFGYWALAVQQLVQVLVALVVLVSCSRWLPRRWARGEDMRPFLRFGWHVAGSQLVTYIGNNTDSVLIGTRFGSTALGLYNRAFQLVMTPLGQLRAPMSTVTIPVLSRLQADEGRYEDALRRGQLVLGYTLVVGLGLVVGGVDPLVAVLLGPEWAGTGTIMRLLAVAGIFQTLAYVGYWVYVSQGLVRDLFRYSLVSTGIRVTCLLVGSHWGVVGVAAGFASAPALSWMLSFWWLARRATIPLRGLVVTGLRIVAVTAAVALAAATGDWLTSDLTLAPRCGAVVVLAAGAYALVAAAVPPVRRDIALVVATARRGAGRRRGSDR